MKELSTKSITEKKHYENGYVWNNKLISTMIHIECNDKERLKRFDKVITKLIKQEMEE